VESTPEMSDGLQKLYLTTPGYNSNFEPNPKSRAIRRLKRERLIGFSKPAAFCEMK
jgi:hypothetical protein